MLFQAAAIIGLRRRGAPAAAISNDSPAAPREVDARRKVVVPAEVEDPANPYPWVTVHDQIPAVNWGSSYAPARPRCDDVTIAGW